ncbi:MAG: hypothetical protein KF856_03190 [Cyclobacteriaceae bacterium]|nr:hypothetical protein [Cyclobacteriaceae bacterium]
MSKLTLSVNPKLVTQAKKYARKKGKSVSKLFEDHIEDLINKEKKKDPLDSIRKLKGIAKGSIPDDVDYKDAIADILIAKHR